MPKTIRSLSLLAATALGLVALAPRVHAQLETFSTLNSITGAGTIGFTGGNTALAQTFTNINELASITFRFTNTGSYADNQSIQAYLVNWSGTAGSGNPSSTFTAPTSPNNPGSDVTGSVSQTPVATFTVPPVGTGSWQTDTFVGGGTYNGYDVTLNLNQFTDPSLTYGIILVDTTAESGLGLLDVNTNPDAFTYGYGTQNSTSGDATLPQMLSDPGAFYAIGRTTADYGFSQIVIVPAGNVVPTPEPREAALLLCAAFVAFLVGRRLLKGGEPALAGAAAA
jgi:hypothetical protein